MICAQVLATRWTPRALVLAKAVANGYRRMNPARQRRQQRMDALSGLEQAIRNALERAERADPDIRARIYQSARNALDAGLRKQEVGDAAVIERQRQRLEVTIREIEDEEMARLRSIARFERVALEREPEPEAPPPVERSEVAADTAFGRRAEPTFAPAPVPSQSAEPLDAEFEDEPAPMTPARPADTSRGNPDTARVEPVVAAERDGRAARQDGPAGDDYLTGLTATREARSTASAPQPEAAQWDDEAAEAIAPARKRSRGIGGFLVSTFVYLFLFGIVGGCVWWVYATGMVDAALKGSSDFQLVPEALRSDSEQPAREEARLDTLRGFSGDWTDIFKPGADAPAVKPRAKANVAEDRDSDGLATIITSNAPDQDGDVLVEVPASLLADLAGKTSIIAVTVKSNTEKPAQIYIQCEFKTLGDCGRHRYTVTNERADELIQLKFDGKMSPSSPGHIVINSDVTGEGSSIRLYGIRVRAGS
jgi:hypothetical protein